MNFVVAIVDVTEIGCHMTAIPSLHGVLFHLATFLSQPLTHDETIKKPMDSYTNFNVMKRQI